MLIPHIKYIEALVMSKKPLEEITEGLEKYALDAPEQALSIIVTTLREDHKEYFDGKSPKSIDPDVIRDMDIAEMFCYFTNFSFPEKMHDPKKAFELIDDPLMYRLITSLALTKVNDEDLEIIVNGKFNMDYSVEDIKIFLKYFFNTEGWTLKDRQDYVNTVTDQQLKPFYKMALKGDKDYLMWKLGAAPEKDFNMMLKDMIHDAYYNFKEQSKVKPDVAQRWANLTVKIADKIDNYEKDDKKSAQSFLDNFDFKIKSSIEASPKKVHLKDIQPDEFEKTKPKKEKE